MTKVMFSVVSVCPWGCGPCAGSQTPCLLYSEGLKMSGGPCTMATPASPVLAHYEARTVRKRAVGIQSKCLLVVCSFRMHCVWGANLTGKEIFHILQPKFNPDNLRSGKLCTKYYSECAKAFAKVNSGESFESISSLLSET